MAHWLLSRCAGLLNAVRHRDVDANQENAQAVRGRWSGRCWQPSWPPAAELRPPRGGTGSQPAGRRRRQPTDANADARSGHASSPTSRTARARSRSTPWSPSSASRGTLTKVKLSYTNKDRQGRTQHGTVAGKINKDRTQMDRERPARTGDGVQADLGGQEHGQPAQYRHDELPYPKPDIGSSRPIPTIYPLKGSHVGVGMPVILTFDVPVKNKREFEKNLHVKSSPAQAGHLALVLQQGGAVPAQEVLEAGHQGVRDSQSQWPERRRRHLRPELDEDQLHRRRSLITKINLSSDVARVYRNGKLVRRIYVSGGKPGWQTRSGVKLIMDKLYVTRMTNHDDRRSRAVQPAG